MKKEILTFNKLYILSGISTSGKSTFLKQLIKTGLPQNAIVSSDQIRKDILGESTHLDNHGSYSHLHGWDIANQELFNIIETTIAIRLKQKLCTFFDATNLTDSERNVYANIAKKYGMEVEVLIIPAQLIEKTITNKNGKEETIKFANQELVKRLSQRKERFSVSSIHRQANNFQQTSHLPYRLIDTNNVEYVIEPQIIKENNLDIVGDTHGLLDETIVFLKQLGWNFENGYFSHPENRKLLFLGDMLDRGPKSIEILRAINKSVKKGTAYFILGNHEDKLINNYENLLLGKPVISKSLSSSQTFMNFMQLSKEERNELFWFLKYSPTFLTFEDDKFKIAFAHANVDYFDPYNFPKSYALYGNGEAYVEEDTDQKYENSYNAGHNSYIYVRGHIPPTSQQNHCFSLDRKQAFAGHLACLRLDEFLKDAHINDLNLNLLFNKHTKLMKTEFNFDNEIASTVSKLKELEKLQKEGYIIQGKGKLPHPDGFKVYKYTPKVHFKDLWSESEILLKARGLGLDIAGNLIIHAFDKLFNYGEKDTGLDLPLDTKVQKIEKLNGFLGIISKHPFKNELLLSTTGTIGIQDNQGNWNSPFIGYISEFIEKDPELKGRLLSHLNENKQSLMFEVIHRDDKHIIEYSTEEEGLYLIGARDLTWESQPHTEAYLDELASKLHFKRPAWEIDTLENVLKERSTLKTEGQMLRRADDHTPLLKIKSDYYLVTKFLGRMNKDHTAFMFSNVEKFKEQKVEEEFWPIVDKIVSDLTVEQFTDMEHKTRTKYVIDIIKGLYSSKSPKIKI